MLLVVAPVGFQVNVLAPLAVNVTELTVQRMFELLASVKLDAACTFIVSVSLVIQPTPLSPYTVYVVVDVGVTVIDEFVLRPGLHV